MSVQDITDRFDDLNPWDRVFSSDSGYTIKVKTTDISPSPTTQAFRITASWCDDNTAKAKTFSGPDYFIIEPHEVTVRPDTPVDIQQLLAEAHAFIVGKADVAIGNFVAKGSLPFVRERALHPMAAVFESGDV